MKPMLKYRGGKFKEIHNFEKYIPNHYETYYEPFLGGGALYFYLSPTHAVLNDINKRVMMFYKDVRDNYKELRKQLDILQMQYENNQNQYEILKNKQPTKHFINKNEDLYYLLRDKFNHKIKSDYLESVLYFFINKTAYSGMIRYNSQGEYNVPFGRYKNFNTQLITYEHNKLLNGAILKCCDFSLLFDMPHVNDFMFIDPPYDCVFSDYGNTVFTSDFDEKEHHRLAYKFKSIKCKALMIIGKTKLTVELYKNYIKDEYKKSYAVNIRNRFKSEAKHLIITNY